MTGGGERPASQASEGTSDDSIVRRRAFVAGGVREISNAPLTAAVLSLLTSDRFDVAIVDVVFLTAFAACEAAETPFVVMHYTLPGATWTGPRREQVKRIIDPFNETRRSLHLLPLPGYGDLLASPAAHLVPTAAALDAPFSWDLPLHYIGRLQRLGEDGDLPDYAARFVLDVHTFR